MISKKHTSIILIFNLIKIGFKFGICNKKIKIKKNKIKKYMKNMTGMPFIFKKNIMSIAVLFFHLFSPLVIYFFFQINHSMLI